MFCDPERKVKVTSDFGHATGGLQHGLNQVEIELKHVADFLKVRISHLFLLNIKE